MSVGFFFVALTLVTPPGADGTHYSSFSGYGHLAAGLSCGLSCLAAGLSIGIAGDAGRPRLINRSLTPRCSRLWSTRENLRRYGADADFRRGSCSVRSDCGHCHRHRHGSQVLS